MRGLIVGAVVAVSVPASQATIPPREKASRDDCDHFAAPWGSKDGSGSAKHPVRGPHKLIELLRAGETGCLRRGTYHEREATVKRERVTLRSAPGERATWRGRIVLRGRGDRLLDLNLDGSTGPPCDEGGCGALPSPTINAADVTIARNDITSPDAGICVHPRSWGSQRPDNFQIVDNRIHDCGRRPPTEHDHGIYVADGYNGVIWGNAIFDNADRGIQLYPHAKFTTVAFNTVDANGTGIVFSERSAGNEVHDNVFTNAVVRWNAESYRLSGLGNRFEDNCIRPGNPDREYNENGGVALSWRVSQKRNRVAADPVYGARGAGDLRVLPTSACAGKGAANGVAAPP
ncbi:MAG TPA: right-handed parallel beta-helix repeat-containing protein [Thermoleophilaceae bacterium]|nr:right-handed parallel beta-helix repeat-containing protein [Thermoleophilaceae bacterium]